VDAEDVFRSLEMGDGGLMRSITIVALVSVTVLAASVAAQKPTPTPLLDSRGLPLPFGVQPYFKPDYPLGSGPYKAIMAVEPGLSAHVAYYPANVSELRTKKLPVVIWGNGSCLYAGNRYRQLLTDIASYGYLVVSGGPMGAVEQEVGPQSNPAPRGRGGAPPAANAASVQGAPQQRVTVALLKEAIDWAVKENGDSASRFNGKLDLSNIVVMGHSCGGGLAVQLASEDPRVTALGIWYSGAGLAGARGNDATSLLKIKGPVLIITGDEKNDIAYGSGKATYEALNHTPVFYAWQDDLQHIGTFGAKDGGDNGVIARNWLEWTTRGDQKASATFVGPNCTLCKDPSWHVFRKKVSATSSR
jgi:dienelactone hydrolase